MRPVAILCGDIHLSLKPPVFRAGEPDWFEAMARGLKQLGRHAAAANVPILCAGDIFDRWHGPVEVINFALDNLPEMYAVPGQHDLPYHRFEDMGKSAFGVLVKAGKVKLLGTADRINGIWVTGFPWNACLAPTNPSTNPPLQIAVVHKYVWLKDEHKHPEASADSNWTSLHPQLEGYDLCVFGDNHKGFYSKKQGIFNCGTFFRRKADEVDYVPRYGILYSDGSVVSVGLDTSLDVYAASDEGATKAEVRELPDFVKSFDSLATDPLDYEAHLDRAIENEDSAVRAAVIKIREGIQDE